MTLLDIVMLFNEVKQSGAQDIKAEMCARIQKMDHLKPSDKTRCMTVLERFIG